MIADGESMDGRGLARTVVVIAAIAIAALAASEVARAQTPTPTPAQQQRIEQAKAHEARAKALLARFTAMPGREDSDALLREPVVRAELKRIVGSQLPKLIQNINVRGTIAFDGGSLVIRGNAPHAGGEEEGVVCVSPHAPSLVEAAIFSHGEITVFATAQKYEYLTLCVKDWITQVNSGHRDRFIQPKNVSVVRAK